MPTKPNKHTQIKQKFDTPEGPQKRTFNLAYSRYNIMQISIYKYSFSVGQQMALSNRRTGIAVPVKGHVFCQRGAP